MGRKYEEERAWLNRKINGINQDNLLKSISKSLKRNKKTVMKYKGLSQEEYKKRQTFLSNCVELLKKERFKKPVSNNNFMQRTYTKEFLNTLIDDIDDIDFTK